VEDNVIEIIWAVATHTVFVPYDEGRNRKSFANLCRKYVRLFSVKDLFLHNLPACANYLEPCDLGADLGISVGVEVKFCPGMTGEKPMRKPRRNHFAKFKAQVALEAIRGEKTIAEIAAHHEVHPTHVTSLKNEVLKKLGGIFGGESSSRDEKARIRM
jgi:hypothetical protein